MGSRPLDPDRPDGGPWTVDASADRPRTGVRRVILPADPPVLSPCAARALLRLLRVVHEQRHRHCDPTPRTPDPNGSDDTS